MRFTEGIRVVLANAVLTPANIYRLPAVTLVNDYRLIRFYVRRSVHIPWPHALGSLQLGPPVRH